MAILLRFCRANMLAMIPQYLLDSLVCPICHKKVFLTPGKDGLKCEACQRAYPIRDGIPVMLVDQAQSAPTEP
jgi:uncharacterized protein YbaR (Trm112 family)